MLFSQRKGIKPIKKVIQIDSMDEDLRNGLWNCLIVIYWENVDADHYRYEEKMNTLVRLLWHKLFKEPLDIIPYQWRDIFRYIRERFFGYDWNEVYDFIEFMACNYPDDSYNSYNEKFIKMCNGVLEREQSAYRFIGKEIAPLTSKEEIASIEEAIDGTAGLRPVQHHLKTALDMLSDRKKPDFRNSIKESISAVEAISKLITKQPKTALGDALKELKNKGIELHPALEKAFQSMYGYTSDADGIRHSLLEESKLQFIDAKFMLVSCSSFINYLIEKSREARIQLN